MTGKSLRKPKSQHVATNFRERFFQTFLSNSHLKSLFYFIEIEIKRSENYGENPLGFSVSNIL
jgi:hypothetical protein